MSVFDTIRSILGLDRSSDGERTELTVESEPSDNRDIDKSVTAGTDATASTDSMTETPSSEPETAAEPAEAAGPATDNTETESEPAENIEDESIDVEDADDEPGGSIEADDESGGDSNGESVETVSGIGPAYAQRLADAGVETVGELRAANASELAEKTELSEKRIAGWQEQKA